MHSLLEDKANKNSHRVANLFQTYEDESQAVVLARLLSGHIPSSIDVLEFWVNGVETKLKKGLSGNAFKSILSSGSDHLKWCQELIEVANSLCQAGASIADSTRSGQLRNIVSDNSIRLKALEPKIMRWKKIADRQPPELTPEALEGAERGAEQIRQGKFKTGEQLLEEINTRKQSE
jgi:hypothetical protein